MKNLRSRGALRELISYWEHWNNKFSSLLMDSEKKNSAQHSLFNLLQNWHENQDVGNLTSTILIFQKLMTTLPHHPPYLNLKLLILSLRVYNIFKIIFL